MHTVCVFCGSCAGDRPEYRQAAVDLGEALVARGARLVYGGGRVGLMGVIADAVLAAGGEVVGVIPAHLSSREVAHSGLTDLRVVGSMHERKQLMFDLSDAFVALPGGLGTLEELLEITTWAQLGLHRKPVGILDVLGYFDGLVTLLDHAVLSGFLTPHNRGLILLGLDPDALLDRLQTRLAPSPPLDPGLT
ncbi:MAG TPA: TIGR00730 family Rossman fold protein [Candidatus Dormibacteraeota bacterium]